MSKASQKLKTVYAKIPSANCKGLCADYCGVIPLFKAEARRILPLTPPEMIQTIGLPMIFDSAKERCPHLNGENRCAIYNARPLICRIWGATEKLPCPFGCRPERVLTETETRALMAQVEKI